MIHTLQALMQQNIAAGRFPPNSRYHGIETSEMNLSDGKTVAYLKRRFVPAPEKFALLQEYTVVEGDRLDNLAAKFLGDPLQFWQLCDANGAVRPEELIEESGRRLRITLPEDVPGAEDGQGN